MHTPLLLPPQDILAALQSSGCMCCSFNPVTAVNVAKVLQRVAEREGCQLSSAAATSLASVSDGDLRNAVQTLQVLYGQQRRHGGGGLQLAAGKKVRAQHGARRGRRGAGLT